MLTRVTLGSLLFLFFLEAARGEPTITTDSPLAVEPGKTTRIVLQGKDLRDPMRFWTSRPAQIEVVTVEPTQATLDVKLEPNAALGPLGLWIATADGPSGAITLLVDDLPSIPDNGSNHQKEQAQLVPKSCGIDGTCDGPLSDFYRLHANANEQLTFEVFAQRLGSKMDVVVRLYDASGKQLMSADDDSNGPDNRFRFRFPTEGDYLIEIFDNRFVAGGRYRMRIGEFPMIDATLPLAAQLGSRQSVRFIGPDSEILAAQDLEIPSSFDSESIPVFAKLPGGTASSWCTLLTSKFPQFSESDSIPETPASLNIPTGISGRLLHENERDQFLLNGIKGQLVRINSRTRSLHLPTMLQMRLFNSANAKVAETAVNDNDEWSIDYTFPEDGSYRLEVSDLLHRGGASFGYYVEVASPPKFAVVFKPDAKTKEQFAVEQQSGAFAIDFQIQRAGYDGPIELAFAAPIPGLKLLNPRIDAKAKEGTIYVFADENWQAESLTGLRFEAIATDAPDQKVAVSSLALHRIKSPHIPFPATWTNGLVTTAGVPASSPFFTLETSAPAVFARQQTSHTATLSLKRTQEAFKGPVSVLPYKQLTNWTSSAKPDKDSYAITWTRTSNADEPQQLPLLAFAEFNGRGRMHSQNVSVSWIDPLKVSIKPNRPLVGGSAQHVEVSFAWDAAATSQPVKLTWLNLPAGMVGPPLEVAAGIAEAKLELQLTPEFAASKVALQLQATSQFAGQPFTTQSETVTFQVIPAPAKLEVFPSVVELRGPKDFRHLVVTGFDELGSPRDWTTESRAVSVNPSIAKIENNQVVAVGNGTTELKIEIGKLTQTIPVTVTHFETTPPTQFENEVLVALSKQSCNSGACHGSPSGKGGFRLSLRAFDQQLDQLTLNREESGRRVNVLEPEKSLMLLKPLMKVAHGGGMQLRKSDPAYEILRTWISEGAKVDPPNTPRCIRLELYPNEKRVLNRAVAPRQQLVAVAHFSDGSSRDVTKLVAYESSNTSVAEVSTSGLVTSRGRGEAAILARFLEHIESAPIMFVEDVPGFEWQAPSPNNFIDTLVNAKLQQLQYLPAETADDSAFLRRVFLDVIGLLPTPEETQTFLATPSPDKRQLLIDSLLNRPEHAKFWALKWGDLLRLTSKNVGNEAVYKYHRWVEQALQENMPYDEFARLLLTASGSTLDNPPANFYRTANDTNDCVETISQVFLGARLQCAKCHNHPFERWTQDNYYGLGAFFQRLQRKKSQRPDEMFVWTSNTGEVTQPRTGEVMKPWLPKIGSIEPKGDEDRRRVFAEWLTNPTNPFFARIEANRIWSQLFSRGIVDPIDDFRDSNPPSNGPLLDALAKEFVDNKFDRKHLLRVILNSRTYQASFNTNKFNEDDVRYFSHQEPRLLSAEQLLDAVNHTTGNQQTFGPLPPGTKATQLPAPDLVKVDFLKVFGQPERSTVCACERADDSNLAMAIELFNGPMIYDRLRDPNNRFRRSLAAGKSIEDIIRELYLVGLCRQPTDVELATSMEHAKARNDPANALEDICWALINTDEFLFQH